MNFDIPQNWLTDLIKDGSLCFRCGEVPGKLREFKSTTGVVKRVYCDKCCDSIIKQHGYELKKTI